MFELGVRLATHPQGTFCLLDETVLAWIPTELFLANKTRQ